MTIGIFRTRSEELGKATGEDGKDGKDGLNGSDGVNGENGKDGDSFFKSVTQDDDNVYFTLKDGSVITVPKAKSDEDLDTIIYYTTYDGNIINPNASKFNGTIISNTYKNGKGVLKFDSVINSIGSFAFSSGCGNLTTITLPDTITFIDTQAFCNCRRLKAFYSKFASSDNRCFIVDGALLAFAPADLTTYNIPSSATSLGDFAFQNVQLTAVHIPNTVTSIGVECFECSYLQSVRIPDSVISIGEFAFSDCNSLANVVIGNKVTTIGQEAFARCAISSITFPSSVVSIGLGAVCQCWNLESMTIGSGVVEVGSFCCSDCNNLRNVYCKTTIPPAIHCTENSGSFTLNSGLRIYVPRNSYNAYTQYTSFSPNLPLAQTNWYGYKSHIEPYDF